jgi:hypothetical protein
MPESDRLPRDRFSKRVAASCAGTAFRSFLRHTHLFQGSAHRVYSFVQRLQNVVV